MADKPEDKIISSPGKSFSFPITPADSFEKSNATQARSLFPSVTVPSNKKESLDWLSNASYSIQTVDGVTPSFQEQKENESTSSSSDEEELLKKAKLEQPEEKDDRKQHKKDKSKKHNKHKHKKHRKQKSIDDQKLTNLPSTIWIEESGLQIEKAFRIHRKPDHDNRAFGGLYRLDIALHSLNPRLKCLGLTIGQEIDSGQKSKRKEKKKSAQRYWNNVNFDETMTIDQTRTKKGFGFSNNFSYVPLELPGAVQDGNNESSTLENEKPVSELLSKTRDLNQRVRENPSDTEAWLALAELQSQQVESSNLDSLNSSTVQKQKKHSKLSLEKKQAVLEQAVENNLSCVELIITYMNVCVETMTSDEILEKWKRILFTQPQKTLLWKHYLMFCQSSFSAFSFSATLAVYTRCFTTLSAIQSGSFISHTPEGDIEAGMVEIFVQFCQFLRQTGQTEKAVAAFQALIEFNCFGPTSLKDHAVTSAVPFFETFWDSDVPRFGEENAGGWNSWMEDKPTTSIPLNEIFPSTTTIKDQSFTQEEFLSRHSEKPTTWLNLETSRDAEQWISKKTSDDDDDVNEDPDRTVLFQDISFVLFKISDEELKFQLVCYFLSFLGNPTDLEYSEPSTVKLERLLHILLEDDKQLKWFEEGNHESFACGWSYSEEKHTSEISMFIRNIFNQSLEIFSKDLQAVLVIFWLTFEKNLVMAEANPKQRKQCYKAVRKLAKSLLKLEQHRNNLRLWFAFVEIEWRYGNFEEARRVVASLLEQLQSLASTDEKSIMRYYHFVRLYCELELGSKNGSMEKEKGHNLESDLRNRILTTISLLVMKSEAPFRTQTTLTPSQILKTHKALQEKSTLMLTDFEGWSFEAVSREKKESLVDFMICYALFQYWSLGIVAAQRVLDALLSAVKSERSLDGRLKFAGSKGHEEIYVFYCKLLQFHSRNNMCPVKPLRDVLLHSLSHFPENAFFLRSYVMLELRSCVSTSVRRYFDGVLPRAKTPFPWLFAILYESKRQKTFQSVLQSPFEVAVGQREAKSSQPTAVTVLPQTGVLHRTRSLYERSIHHPSARHCIAIWRSYMKFEAENGDLRQAKAIFYQSLQCCAWSKVLYLDAMTMFPDSFQDIYDMMEEKELRIRTPLEELELLLET